MNKTCKLITFILVSIVTSSGALAQSFTGPRVEAHLGYDRASVFGFDQGGLAYGIGVGYDFGITPSLIVGVELNADLATTGVAGSSNGITVKISAERDLSALVRFGGKINDSTLIYVKAGYVNVRLAGIISDATDPSNNFSAGFNGSGIPGDSGVEFALSRKSYAKVEYQYTNYEAGFSRNQGLVGVGFRF